MNCVLSVSELCGECKSVVQKVQDGVCEVQVSYALGASLLCVGGMQVNCARSARPVCGGASQLCVRLGQVSCVGVQNSCVRSASQLRGGAKMCMG